MCFLSWRLTSDPSHPLTVDHMTTESGHDIICRKLLNNRTTPFLNTWKDADVICSPSCMFCCSWFCIVIFFSLVMEAMGKLRTTVCSPTIGRQDTDSATALHSSFSRVFAAHFSSLCWRNVSEEDYAQEHSERKCHDSRISFINFTAWQFTPETQSFPRVKELSQRACLCSTSPISTKSPGLRQSYKRQVSQKKEVSSNTEKISMIFNVRIKQKRRGF